MSQTDFLLLLLVFLQVLSYLAQMRRGGSGRG